MLKKIICLILLYLCISCSNNNSNSNIDKNINILNEPETLYKLAKINFDEQKLGLARGQFKEIVKLFPLSNEAIQSEIMIAFIDYIQMDYDNAILNYKKIISKYPSHKDLDYIYYMIAMCNYEQLQNEELDGYYNDLALNSFNQVITRFPDSKYSKDSRQKIILVKSNIAAKHMSIGRFYQKQKKYTAALNRYKVVMNSFQETKFTPEALYRISEIYLSLGMKEESKKNAAVLGYNYPDSIWYKFIYDDLTGQNNETIFSKSIGKIFN